MKSTTHRAAPRRPTPPTPPLTPAGIALREAYRAEDAACRDLENVIGRVEALAVMLEAVGEDRECADEKETREARGWGEQMLREEIAKLRPASAKGNYVRLVQLAQAAPDVSAVEPLPAWAVRSPASGPQ